ncbi:DUF6801 domain-containing protein [Streptomyces sp. TLI_146]|uniref:DUF6801 domain-containing protein n=1 Tax=Streptomyces sp. TLI_146 TaxID=1938858 RepID=UPI000C714F36|nr:DUF6801 domain-containing protein [Streptomyces sp. TLI_146]PKV88907.1 hypothetical protein BX283_6535 [Streptomyces sp. TLI_146]
MGGAFDRRGAAIAATLGVIALLLGLVPASGTIARDRETGVQAIYDCAAGSVHRAVTVGFAGVHPTGGRPGQPLRTERFTVRPELTRDAVTALLPPGTAEVSGTARLAVEVAQNGASARADWAGLVAPAARAGADGPQPVFAGEVPVITLGSPGEVTLVAGELTLMLQATPAPASPSGPASPSAPASPSGQASTPAPGASDSPGAPQLPASTAPLELRCRPAAPTGPRLAVWTVTEPSAPSTAPAPSTTAGTRTHQPAIQVGPAPLATAPVCPADPPAGELDPSRLPKPPPGAVEGHLGASLCVVAVGYATVHKLGSAMVVNDPHDSPGPMHLNLGKRTVSAPDYDESDSVGLLRFPDARSTFLTFGFQPTSASVGFEPEPVTVVNIRRGETFTTTIAYRQHLRIHDVRVNGVPLDVGPRCRTARPFDTVLSGAYNFLTGGVLDGEIAIPPFAGCGSRGEDLSPLFTAALSGPGNAVRIRQGQLAGAGSAPPVPELPRR